VYFFFAFGSLSTTIVFPSPFLSHFRKALSPLKKIHAAF